MRMSEVLRRGSVLFGSFAGGSILGFLVGFALGWLAFAILNFDTLPGNPGHENWATLASVVGPVALVGAATLVISLVTRRARGLCTGLSLGLFWAAFVWWWITSSFLGAPG